MGAKSLRTNQGTIVVDGSAAEAAGWASRCLPWPPAAWPGGAALADPLTVALLTGVWRIV